MGSQRTISKYNLEYFHEDLVAGDYDMPTIYPTVYEPKQLIGFNYLNTALVAKAKRIWHNYH